VSCEQLKHVDEICENWTTTAAENSAEISIVFLQSYFDGFSKKRTLNMPKQSTLSTCVCLIGKCMKLKKRGVR